MAKELILEVIARKNSKDLNTLADDFEKLAARSDTAGKSLNKTATFSQHLDGEIAKTKQTIRELGQEFDKTGNKDVFAKLRGAQANLRSLEGIKKQLTTALGDVENQFDKAGQKAGRSFVGSISDEIDQWSKEASGLASPAGIALGTALVVAATPVIAAGILAAVGGGLLGVAALVQKNNPAIQKAFGGLKDDLKSTLGQATQPLQEGLANALTSFDKFIIAQGPTLKKAFSALAPAIGPLAQSLQRFLQPIIAQLPRLAKTFSDVFADPRIQKQAASIGKSIADLFGTIAANQQVIKNVIAGVAGIFKVATTAADALLNVTNALAAAFQNWWNAQKAIPGVGLLINKIGSIMGQTSGESDKLGTSLNDTATSAYKVAVSMTQAGDATQRYANAVARLSNQLAQDQANIAYQQSIDDLTKSIQANGRSFDITGEKGRANKTALDQVVQSMLAVRDAAIQAAGGQNASKSAVEAANRVFNAQVAALRAQLHALGYSDAAIRSMLGDVNQLASALNKLKDKTVHVNVVYRVQGGNATVQAGRVTLSAKARGGYRKAAAGLIVPPSDPGTILMGEPQTGGEALIPFRGITRQAATGLINTVGAGYGLRATSSSGWRATSAAQPGYTTITAGDALMRAFVTLIQTYVQGAGGDGRTLGIVTVRG